MPFGESKIQNGPRRQRDDEYFDRAASVCSDSHFTNRPGTAPLFR
jgi:hypothetical protein